MTTITAADLLKVNAMRLEIIEERREAARKALAAKVAADKAQREEREERARALEESAAAKRREAYDSYMRCDTDGALSQWANGVNAQKDTLQAQIERDGGRHWFPALFDLEGNLIAAKHVEGRYGMVWGILADDDPNGRIVEWFNESRARDDKRAEAANARKGYYVGAVMARAKAQLHGASITSVMAYAQRLDGGFSRDVEILDNGQD